MKGRNRLLEERTTMVASPPPPGQVPCPCGREAYAEIRYGTHRHGVSPRVWTFCDVDIERAWACRTQQELANLVLELVEKAGGADIVLSGEPAFTIKTGVPGGLVTGEPVTLEQCEVCGQLHAPYCCGANT